jgi:hypothetical protein
VYLGVIPNAIGFGELQALQESFTARKERLLRE